MKFGLTVTLSNKELNKQIVIFFVDSITSLHYGLA